MAQDKRFCAYCGHHRAVYTKKHVSLLDVLGATGLGLASASLIAQQFDPRGFLISALGIGIAEIFVSFRYRLRLICGRCGFDPVLYRRDPSAAAERVKRVREERLNHPVLALAEPGLPVAMNPEFRSRLEEKRSRKRGLNPVTQYHDFN